MGILDLLYPRRCGVCGRVLPYGETGVCKACTKELSYVSQPACLQCGKELSVRDEFTAEELCADCRKVERDFSGGIALLHYNDAARKIMAQLKYRNCREYAEFLADEMAKRYGKRILGLQIEAFVPVPIHKKKLRERGYNQAALLAKRMGMRLEIPVADSLILRVENTKAQKQLGYAERQRNERKAFRPSGREDGKKFRRVMLVDDIYTTGATAQACTKALLQSGVKEVYLANMAIGHDK